MSTGFQPPPPSFRCVRFSVRYIINMFLRKTRKRITTAAFPLFYQGFSLRRPPSAVFAFLSVILSMNIGKNTGVILSICFSPLFPPRSVACFSPQTFRRGNPRPEVPPPVPGLPAAPAACLPAGIFSRCRREAVARPGGGCENCPAVSALCGLFCPSDVPAGISPPGKPSARFPPSCGSCGLFPAGNFLPFPLQGTRKAAPPSWVCRSFRCQWRRIIRAVDL